MRLKWRWAFGVFLMLFPIVFRGQIESGNRDVYIVPFSHLDLYWACTQEECLSRGNYIITRAVQLAKGNPGFRFLLEDDDFIANFEDSHRGAPELEDLKRLVKQGRIEVAPLWASIYLNEPRGEALVRNLMYGKIYARETFGVDPTVAHLADMPGFTWQYPQILTKSATPYMVMTRMGPPNLSLFRWKAPDGSAVLVWNEINGYGWGVSEGLHLDLDQARLTALSHDIAGVQATTHSPVYLPWGMDLFAPSKKLIENVGILNQKLTPNRFLLATPEEFFRVAARVPDIPELSGEIPSSWVSITRVPLWPAAMSATDALLNAEKFAVINFAMGYAPYPEQEFDALWKDNLKSLDHNSDGQGGKIGDERKLGFAEQAELGANQILRDSLRNIAERVRGPLSTGTSIVVFNSLNWKRDDVVRAHVTLFGSVDTDQIDDYKRAMRLVDGKGVSIPFQIEQYREASSRALDLVFVARDVPSLGYKTFYLQPAEKADTFPNACEVKLQSDQDAKQAGSTLGQDVLENRYYRIKVDRTTGSLEIFDKELNRDVAKNISISAIEERGGDDQNITVPSGRTIVDLVDDVALEENGPVRAILRVTGAIGGMPVVQRIAVYKDLKKIDLEDSVEWNSMHSINMQQMFPLEQPDMEIRNSIPFGSVLKTAVMPGAGPTQGDEETPQVWKSWRQIQDWVFAGAKDWGLTISADHQLMIENDDAIGAGMVRAARFSPTQVVENGQIVLKHEPAAATYVFHYSLASTKGDWVAAKPWRSGMALRFPLLAVSSADPLSQKTLPPDQSFLSVDADNIVITAVKKSQRDDGIIVRGFDVQGSGAQSTVHFLGQQRDFRETNMLEEVLPSASQRTWSFRPYEINTIKVTVSNSPN